MLQHFSRRWLWSAAISLVICAAWFGYGMRADRCWMYGEPYDLAAVFLIVWLLLLLFLGFKTQGRFILLALILLAAMLWANVQRSDVPAAEAGAVGRLRQLNAAMADYKSEHQSYPGELPNVSSSRVVDRYYRFDLVSSRSPDGKIVDYLIQATPRHFPCARTHSFAIASDWRVFYAIEPRPATDKDQLLQ